MVIQRRDFLKLSTFSFLAMGLSQKAHSSLGHLQQKIFNPMQMSPIQKLASSDFQSQDFNGDNINRPHDLLWNIDGHLQKKGGIPLPTEKRKVVIVGGGLSGLLSAYFLKDHDPLLLEQDRTLGGNCKGEDFQGSLFSIGAAYITPPETGSDVEKLLNELELMKESKTENTEDVLVNFKNQLMKDFWNGASDPKRANEFKKVDAKLRQIYNESFPDIPWTEQTKISKSEYNRLDQMTFLQWLEENFGEVHPHILEYFQLYCWSSFNASISELSALQALNFIAAEVDGVITFPGGNAAITQKLFKKLNQHLSPQSLRNEAMVLRVDYKKENEIWITYENAEGTIQTVATEKCIIAAPKFIAKFIVQDIPLKQKELMDKMNYRGYLVANAIYANQLQSPAYDVYCLEGDMPDEPAALKPPKRNFSDICFGSWAQNDSTSNGVITIYKSLPYDGARQFLFNPGSHDKHKNLIIAGLLELEKSIGIDSSKRKGLRLTRWGHAIPIAETKLLSSQNLDLMNQPIQHSIYFANQDNWANPSFECAFAAAQMAAHSIAEQLA